MSEAIETTETTETNETERYSRQATLVNRDHLNRHTYHLIGCGSVGRQWAHLLAHAGVNDLHVWDNDIIDESNIATQGWLPHSIGTQKVVELGEELEDVHPDLVLRLHRQQWTMANRLTSDYDRPCVVLSAVDSIAVRTRLHKAIATACALFVDVRTLGETVYCLAAQTPADHKAYRATLFPPEEAEGGTCTRPNALYTATLAASLGMYQIARWSRGASTFRQLGGLPCELTIID